MLSSIFHHVPRLFLLLAAVMMLQSCNNGANDSGAGRIRLLVSDAPSSDFDQVNITVNSIELLGEGPGVYLTNQPMTFNLLDLRNVSTSLGVNDSVPVGTYTKLRMDVSKIELVKLNPDGSVSEKVSADLPSGHIDLNPQSQITVAPGSDLVMQMDINAENSFQVTTTGSGKYIFRPQVFVSVLSDASTSLVKLSGTALDISADSFKLCATGATQVSSDCETVNVTSGAEIRNADMDGITYSNIKPGDSVVAFGLLSSKTLELNARDIFDGVSQLSSFKGDFSDSVSADSADISISQNSTGVTAGDSLPVTPISNADVLNKEGNILDASAIAAGVSAQVIGVLESNTSSQNFIKPGLVILAQ